MTLRLLEPDDIDLFRELDSDPEVMRFVDTGRAPPREVFAGEVLPRLMKVAVDHPGLGWFTAVDRITGEKLGWFHFRPAREAPHDVELGYRFKRVHWGRGLATEGARALLDHGFSALGLPRVIALALVANRASWRVMEKLGMTREHEFTEHAVVHPEKRAVRYGLGRAEWLTARGERRG